MVSVLECVRGCMQRVAPAGAGASEGAGAACDLALQVLEGLSSTRRFSMLLMFLDAKQQAVVRAVFAELKRLARPAPSALAQAWEA